jgi:hypothetical protein
VGKPVFVPLDRVRTHRNTDKRGTFRWYNDYRLPEHLGGGVVTVRLHANAEDAKRKFNRAENVRQIPPGDPDFEVLYRRRNDAESINRHLDDTLWLRRAHSVGNRRQLLNMITYALGVNALSMHVRRQGLAPPQGGLSPESFSPRRSSALRNRRTALVALDTSIGSRRARLRALRWPIAIRRRRFNGVFSRESRRSRLSSSMVEQWTFNPLVQGSSPWGGTSGPNARRSSPLGNEGLARRA